MIEGAKPRLARSVRLRHDRVRDRWLLLAPERGFVLNGSALAIVRLLDGTRTLAEVAAQLGSEAARDVAGDIDGFVHRLQERGLVEA